ncbi:Uracil-DNA glycosylase [Limimonas halophila]|uniref:Uracil-DNA glycosylase n=1 Tax=Limimonas halophila TaxID=1082479 RepID=A0A1G7UF41_9PROT|nr:uracil-DNA glycosylase family protein [Limimonas halophila]SDG46067.1 Uracil-DNA glycosylase [Limimonas halophila]
MSSEREDVATVLREARACRVCEDVLPHGPNPVLRAGVDARILIVGQAPGWKVHTTGIPWNDPSGDRLRAWMNLDRETFYDETRIAIAPIAFCYPGKDPRGGDLPPRPECAPLWQPRLIAALPRLELILLVGQHAQRYHLGPTRRRTLTETVRAYRDHLPRFLPLPHPSWRNNAWLARNPWFETELLPELRARVHALLG